MSAILAIARSQRGRNSSSPDILTFKGEITESSAVGAWITSLLAEGYLPHEIGVIVREHAQRARAVDAEGDGLQGPKPRLEI